ncbi:hypothetical protein JCM19000A_06780 [Silvimonas sp. JCM 19000]
MRSYRLGQSHRDIGPDARLDIEVSVGNTDIRVVDAGQDAIIKIERFLYTRYCYLTGKVIKVSNDAAQDKKKGLIYPARVTLPTNRIHVDNKWVNLTPGMNVTVEVKTGKRRVAEYFLSPLVEYASESLRER